jgi:hypothetical protein
MSFFRKGFDYIDRRQLFPGFFQSAFPDGNMDRLNSPKKRKLPKVGSNRNRTGSGMNREHCCGICGGVEVYFDFVLDINVCLRCGAHETAVGWQAR